MIRPNNVARILIFAAVMSASVQVLAQRVAHLGGAANIGCGEYLQDRKEDRYAQFYSQWVLGFIAGYNFYASQPQTSSTPKEATVHAYLEKYCRENPLKDVGLGAMTLITDLGGQGVAK